MAMVKCKECGKDVSNQAAACPQCGAPVVAVAAKAPKKKTGCASVIVVFGLIVIVGIGVNTAMMKEPAAPSMSPEQVKAAIHGANAPTPAQAAQAAAEEDARQRTDAAGACILLTQRALNDPDSAQFPLASEASVSKTKNGLWKVRFNGRAKNGYGALVLKTFRCTLGFDQKTQKWVAMSLDE